MKTFKNCVCCGTELEPIVSYYPDGGGDDGFTPSLEYPSYPYCEGCDEHMPEEAKEIGFINYHYGL